MKKQKQYSPEKFDTAAALIKHLKEKKQFNASLPINIDKISELLGINVIYSNDFDSYDTIGSVILEKDKATVRINSRQNDYEPRRRFTLAHEIGHLCRHLSESRNTFIDTHKSMDRTASYWDTLESEANAFAAQLLMPKELVLNQGNNIISEYKDKHKVNQMPVEDFVEKMSHIFVVSYQAMKYRLKNLGLLEISKN
ncbi:protein containing DUF955 [Candidatus Magnetomorum sp. HK-1]|nr:protein containing DUF955 [Candidatus Magnetomorum sp. HK-1]